MNAIGTPVDVLLTTYLSRIIIFYLRSESIKIPNNNFKSRHVENDTCWLLLLLLLLLNKLVVKTIFKNHLLSYLYDICNNNNNRIMFYGIIFYSWGRGEILFIWKLFWLLMTNRYTVATYAFFFSSYCIF